METLYRTKKDLTAAVRAILSAYKPGSRVSPEPLRVSALTPVSPPRGGPEDEGRPPSVRGPARSGFERVSAFWIIRDDGSAVAWSTTELISPPSPLARFRKVCRYAVDDYLREVKTAWLRDNASDGHFICSVTGERVPAGVPTSITSRRHVHRAHQAVRCRARYRSTIYRVAE